MSIKPSLENSRLNPRISAEDPAPTIRRAGLSRSRAKIMETNEAPPRAAFVLPAISLIQGDPVSLTISLYTGFE
ncbi:MAG: hypothetical protein QXS26_04435 [Thermosphaera sp.]